eukprot:NODE_289_length_2295_cov_162.962600_g224_i0.p1 GENE.NODE_289_length_2295_cov_162.962600_g224_i0~~NODE_289_length_2295_cov_162.962600_g224_i0.p1  ORF type:complete len:713 (-),score=288.21 NODE_289_length_2295_cov_162.962600_g224_i0:156-2138(-)
MEVCKQQNKVLQRHEELHEAANARIDCLEKDNRRLSEQLDHTMTAVRNTKDSLSTQTDLRLQTFQVEVSERLPELLRASVSPQDILNAASASFDEIRHDVNCQIRDIKESNFAVASTVADTKCKLMQEVLARQFDELREATEAVKAAAQSDIAEIKSSEVMSRNFDLRVAEQLGSLREEFRRELAQVRETDHWQALTDGRLAAQMDQLQQEVNAMKAHEEALNALRGEVDGKLSQSRDNQLINTSTVVDAKMAVVREQIESTLQQKIQASVSESTHQVQHAAVVINSLQTEVEKLKAHQSEQTSRLVVDVQALREQLEQLQAPHHLQSRLDSAVGVVRADLTRQFDNLRETMVPCPTEKLLTQADMEGVREGITAALTLSVRSTHDEMHRRFAVLDDTLSGIRDRQAVMEAFKDDLAAVHGLKERLASLSAQTARIEYLDASLQVLSSDFKRLGSDGETRNELESLRGQVNDLSRTMPSVKNFLSQTDRRGIESTLMSYVDANMKDISRQISSMDQQSSTSRDSLRNLRAELMASIEGKLANSSFGGASSGGDNSLRRGLVDVQQAVGGLREDVARVQDGFIASAGEIKDVELRFDAKLEGLASALEEFEMQIRKCFTDVAASPAVLPHAMLSIRGAAGRPLLAAKSPTSFKSEAQDPDA